MISLPCFYAALNDDDTFTHLQPLARKNFLLFASTYVCEQKFPERSLSKLCQDLSYLCYTE